MNAFKAIRNLLLLIILILIFYLITYSITKYTGFIVSDSNDKFMDCLKGKDVELYVYEDISEVNLINLDKFDFNLHKCKIEELKCLGDNIYKYPTWIVDKNLIEKDVNIFELADILGCEIY